MPSIGPTELVLVFLIALVVLGPKRLPEVGRQVGRMLREFRSATSQIRSEMGVDDLANDVRDIRSSIGVDDLTRDVGDLKREVDDAKQSLSVDTTPGAAASAAAEAPPAEPGQTAAESATTPAARDEDQSHESLTATAGALFAVPSTPVDRVPDTATPATASEPKPSTPSSTPDAD